MSNLCHFFHILLVLWTIPDAFGQSATLGGTNFVTGRGFCFGDQQLTQGPPVITCNITGYTGSSPVGSASPSWFINGNTAISSTGVAALYPGRLQGMGLVATGQHLEVLNVTDSGVTSVACSLIALNTNNIFLFQTNQTAAENIEGAVSSVPAPNITKVTPSGNQVTVSVSRPSGLCTAFTVSAYQYTVYRSADDVVVMNTNSSDNTATLTGLVLETQYRLEVQAVVEVISQSMVAISNFTTTNDTDECSSSPPPCSHVCNNTFGGYFCSCPNGYSLTSNNFTCEEETTSGTAPPPVSSPLSAEVSAGIGVGILLPLILAALIFAIIIYCCCCRKNTVKVDSRSMMMHDHGEEGVHLAGVRHTTPGVQNPTPGGPSNQYDVTGSEPEYNVAIRDQPTQQARMPASGPSLGYEEVDTARPPQPKKNTKIDTIKSETGSQPEKPKRGMMKDQPTDDRFVRVRKGSIERGETITGELYAMPAKKAEVKHKLGPVTGEFYAESSNEKKKGGLQKKGGYGADGPQ